MSITKTILKNDGIFVYEDYLGPKAARRLSELTAAEPQPIKRTSNSSEIVGVLVTPAWYAAKVVILASNLEIPPEQTVEVVTDDFMSMNLSSMLDEVQGHAQTKALQKKMAAEGTTNAAYKTFHLIRSKQFAIEDNQKAPLPSADAVLVGGNVVALLLHPAVYDILLAAV